MKRPNSNREMDQEETPKQPIRPIRNEGEKRYSPGGYESSRGRSDEPAERIGESISQRGARYDH